MNSFVACGRRLLALATLGAICSGVLMLTPAASYADGTGGVSATASVFKLVAVKQTVTVTRRHTARTRVRTITRVVYGTVHGRRVRAAGHAPVVVSVTRSATGTDTVKGVSGRYATVSCTADTYADAKACATQKADAQALAKATADATASARRAARGQAIEDARDAATTAAEAALADAHVTHRIVAKAAALALQRAEAKLAARG